MKLIIIEFNIKKKKVSLTMFHRHYQEQKAFLFKNVNISRKYRN